MEVDLKTSFSFKVYDRFSKLKFMILTDTGLEKSSPQDYVSLSWKFRSTPLSNPLLIFRDKFERENSHGL